MIVVAVVPHLLSPTNSDGDVGLLCDCEGERETQTTMECVRIRVEVTRRWRAVDIFELSVCRRLHLNIQLHIDTADVTKVALVLKPTNIWLALTQIYSE